MVLQSWARGPVYTCIHQSQDTGRLYEWSMKDMILEDAPLFSQKQSLEGSGHGYARKWPLVICFPRPLLLYHVDAQLHPLSPIVLSPGFALSVLVYVFLQGNTDAISPMMSSLIPPSLNLYSTKH